MSDPDYSLGFWGELKRSVVYTGRLLRPKPRKESGCNGCLGIFAILGILVLLCGVGLGPIGPGIKRGAESTCVQRVHGLGLAMFQYAVDNDGNYPDGKSSTEVFQKLLDGGYVTDPTFFFIPGNGKTRPVPGQKLKPENVCFDVTSGLLQNSPPELPVVFLTGFKIAYVPGSSAVPTITRHPQFGGTYRTWSEWWHNDWPMGDFDPGIAVHYMANNSMWRNLETAPNGDGTIPNFVSPDFKPDGKTYRQLTPEGVLP